MGAGLHGGFKNTLSAKLEDIDTNQLSKKSPIKIPKNADIKKQIKNGYIQIKYIWKSGSYEYIARWHTPTPGSPINYPSWIVERKIPGIGFGKVIKSPVREILLKNQKWISQELWKKATTAKYNNVLTKELKEILDNGHHRDKE